MQSFESRSECIQVRGLGYNVRHWGEEGAPKLFMLHGWMDASPTFQFVVEQLQQSWHVIAPDWRGYGASEWVSRPYWFADYYGDLDGLLNHYAPGESVRLVGHSMGASIAGTYAGARPDRVRQLVMMDFLGLKPVPEAEGPTHLATWLDAIEGRPRLRVYPDWDALARRLQGANPRLSLERASFLARHVGRRCEAGGVEMACDPWHKVPSPQVYRVEDALASWRTIIAPVLLLIARQGFVQQRFEAEPEELERRIGCFGNARVRWIDDAGHNIQHDQPEKVALELEQFLRFEP